MFCNQLLKLEDMVMAPGCHSLFKWLLVKTYISLKKKNRSVELMTSENFQGVFQ